MDKQMFSVLADFDQIMKKVDFHNNPALLERAKNLIPLDKLERESLLEFRKVQKQVKENKQDADESILREEIFLTSLVKWFKHQFFKWFQVPKCTFCKICCVFSGTDPLSMRETYSCPQCRRQELFFRISDTSILLQTRVGRCQEHAQVFHVILKSLNYNSRIVYDFITDHVWNEVYSRLKKKWIHVDPSEATFDEPLMYELGWKKFLRYAIAFGDTGIQDVTWRYVSRDRREITERSPELDKILIKNIEKNRNLILSGCSVIQKRILLEEIIRELSELMNEYPKPKGEYEGRKSGSLEWRLSRGEISSQVVNVGYVINLHLKKNLVDNDQAKFHLWYNTNNDKYCMDYEDKDGDYVIKKGWCNLAYSYSNIVRKEELDWRMTYLARKVGDQNGFIKWVFKAHEGCNITGVYIMTSAFTCNGGKVLCRVSTFNYSISFETPYYNNKYLMPTKDLTVEISLSGGENTNSWQHAQAARQPVDSGSQSSFGIILYLKRENGCEELPMQEK